MESSAFVGKSSAGTSTDKALDVCEVLSRSARGLSVSDVARAAHLPVSSAHRVLAVLKRRGYVRQDEDTARYSLSLKMLDVMFRALGGSELRLHAYPLVRDYVLRTSHRMFLAIPATGEVTYLWTTAPDEVAMRTVYGREMPLRGVFRRHGATGDAPSQLSQALGRPRGARARTGARAPRSGRRPARRRAAPGVHVRANP
jgi:hypothetical protein